MGAEAAGRTGSGDPTLARVDWHNSYFSATGGGPRVGERGPRVGGWGAQGGGTGGPGRIHSPPTILCPPKCSDSVPSHPRGQQQPRSQYLQVIQRADPPHPNSLLSLGIWSLLYRVGLGGGIPKSDPSFSTSLFPDHWAWSLKTPHSVLPKLGEGPGVGATQRGRLLCPLPLPWKVGFRLGRRDGHTGCPRSRASGLGSVRLFSFAVGGGGRGNEHWGWGG